MVGVGQRWGSSSPLPRAGVREVLQDHTRRRPVSLLPVYPSKTAPLGNPVKRSRQSVRPLLRRQRYNASCY